MKSDPTAEIDRRFSEPDAGPTPWPDALHVLEHAELYWLTTVRSDGRPHVTPLIAVLEDGAVHFCTGLREQKARNLEHRTQVALTTGNNTWARGLDIVVEGTAIRVVDRDALQRSADAFESKYGSAWHFEVGDGVFVTGHDPAAVFRIEPTKVLAFAKEPHAQTTFRFTGRRRTPCGG
jgi:nitroimidazol reductase NimA-like FMN-containing flavoprotein (pyridoxamine 5'-phosphate oxidase superfamily)